jgi:hypothetical protein
MIQFDFFYRPRDSKDPMRRGEVTIETARPDEDDWSCRIIISEPIAIDTEILGMDPLQAIELSLNFVCSLLTRHPTYACFRWENDDSTSFEYIQPMTWTTSTRKTKKSSTRMNEPHE